MGYCKWTACSLYGLTSGCSLLGTYLEAWGAGCLKELERVMGQCPTYPLIVPVWLPSPLVYHTSGFETMLDIPSSQGSRSWEAGGDMMASGKCESERK